jgi:hypothetical protein
VLAGKLCFRKQLVVAAANDTAECEIPMLLLLFLMVLLLPFLFLALFAAFISFHSLSLPTQTNQSSTLASSRSNYTMTFPQWPPLPCSGDVPLLQGQCVFLHHARCSGLHQWHFNFKLPHSPINPDPTHEWHDTSPSQGDHHRGCAGHGYDTEGMKCTHFVNCFMSDAAGLMWCARCFTQLKMWWNCIFYFGCMCAIFCSLNNRRWQLLAAARNFAFELVNQMENVFGGMGPTKWCDTCWFVLYGWSQLEMLIMPAFISK